MTEQKPCSCRIIFFLTRHQEFSNHVYHGLFKPLSPVFATYYFIPWFLFLITQFSFSYPVRHSICSSYLSVLFWNLIPLDAVVRFKYSSTLWWSLDLKRLLTPWEHLCLKKYFFFRWSDLSDVRQFIVNAVIIVGLSDNNKCSTANCLRKKLRTLITSQMKEKKDRVFFKK